MNWQALRARAACCNHLPMTTPWLHSHLLVASMLTAFTSMGILPCLILERPVYVRERADGLYRPITYLCYKARPAGSGRKRGRAKAAM